MSARYPGEEHRVQVGPLEILIVLIIALLIFGGRFARVGKGAGRGIGGRLRRTKEAVAEAGQGVKEGYGEEPEGDSRVTRAARRSREQVEAAGRSIPDAARGAKDGFVEEGPATSRLGRAAEGAGRRTRAGGEAVAGTAASAGRELKAGLTGEESEADGRVGRGARAGGDYLRTVGSSLGETGRALREGIEGKDDPDEDAQVVDEAPKAIEPPRADAPQQQPADPPERHQRPA
jgi:Sec-independent protein translocase protein TatA